MNSAAAALIYAPSLPDSPEGGQEAHRQWDHVAPLCRPGLLRAPIPTRQQKDSMRPPHVCFSSSCPVTPPHIRYYFKELCIFPNDLHWADTLFVIEQCCFFVAEHSLHCATFFPSFVISQPNTAFTFLTNSEPKSLIRRPISANTSSLWRPPPCSETETRTLDLNSEFSCLISSKPTSNCLFSLWVN